MDASSSLVVTAAPEPPPPRPEVPHLAAVDAPGVAKPPSPWPRSAQAAAAALLLLAAGLLAWHGWTALGWGARPTELAPEAEADERIDLNRADHAQLLQLPGVGDLTAQRIDDYRRAHHGFRSVDELRRVSGVGPALVNRLRPYLEVTTADDSAEDDDRVALQPTHKRVDADAPRPTAGKKRGEGPADPIDLNRASAEELQQLPGIGPALSGRIVQARERRPFQSVDELRRVKGIGAKTLENIRPFVKAD